MTEYKPDWVSAPGDTIADLMEEVQWTRRMLADRLGMSLRDTELLLAGDLPIDQTVAEALYKATGVEVGFWLRREAHYREGLARGLTRW